MKAWIHCLLAVALLGVLSALPVRAQEEAEEEAPPEAPEIVNLIPDGQLEAGEFSVFAEQGQDSAFTVELLDETPLPGESELNGDYCQKVVIKEQTKDMWRKHLPVVNGVVDVDPAKVYRIRMRLYIPAATRVYLMSYAQDAEKKQIKVGEDRAWEWNVGLKGPTDGFQWCETTIGPEGSGAKYTFAPETARLATLLIRMYDEGDTFYIDDLIVEEVEPEAPAEEEAAE